MDSSHQAWNLAPYREASDSGARSIGRTDLGCHHFKFGHAGGGVQSSAIAALIVQGRLPKPDLAVIADTERERSGTWEYLDRVLRPALLSVGVDVVRIRKSDYRAPDIWQGSDGDTISMPVFFRKEDGKIARAPGYCSNEWKSRVIDRWLREQGIKKSDTVIWLGISLDELRRVRVGMYRYPLIYDVPMRRGACLKLIHDIGWPDAPKSACWMCPNARNAEWRELRGHWPEDWAKAVALDYELRSKDPNVYLHDSGVPLDKALIDVVDSGQMNLGDQCAGMCWV